MSRESVQFAELVRLAHAKVHTRPPQTVTGYELYCERCNAYTIHTLKCTRSHEIYTCTWCGNRQEFKVR